jgi:hypothetical protein
MQINVSSNIKEITRNLSRYQKDQIPFAASQTINQLATRLSFNVLPQKTTEVFQGGAVPFTQKGFRYKRSNKRNLIATVFIDPARAKYMQFMVQGGTRFPDKRAILVATSNSKLNKYGNIPRGTLQDMIQNKTKFFNGIPKGKQGSNYEGIWERYGRKTGKNAGQRIRMVARYEDKAEYKPLFPFGTFVRDVVFSRNDGFAKLFRNNLNRAIASKR